MPETGAQEVEAVIDTGCTRCLIWLGIRMRPLAQPICFEQVDGTLIGGAPAKSVTELIRLEMGRHQELI